MRQVTFLHSAVLAAAFSAASAAAGGGVKPNIMFLLTDDQDMALGGLTPMRKLKTMLVDKGTLFVNGFVTTPICCPSRSSILTGKYIHNHGAHNNSASGNCAGQDWLDNNEKSTMATSLQSLGYKTMFAGKYLNQYGTHGSPSLVTHVPPGWTSWLGLVGNSQYYNYAVSDNGIEVKHGSDYATDYFTDVVANRSYQFLANMSAEPKTPWFMYMATPASHGPDTCAPQYCGETFGNATAPRNPNFNHWSGDKHWLMRYAPPMTYSKELATDTLLRKRWQTLLSVDDIVEQLITRVTAMGQMERTFFFFFSDNGYHLGQFCFGADKRQPYEADIRVPFAVMGPGIAARKIEESIALNIDLNPTFTELAGGTPDPEVDGISLVPLLLRGAATGSNRQDFLVDYYGEGDAVDGIYGPLPHLCTEGTRGGSVPLSSCGDAWNNTYHCVRMLVTPQDTQTLTRMYCEFEDTEHYRELYEMKQDPWQLVNQAYSNSSTTVNVVQEMAARLGVLRKCAGPSCRANGFDLGTNVSY